MSARRQPIHIVCVVCGSPNVSRDAWSQWDTHAQEWTLRAVFDFAYCHNCDCEQTLTEVPLLGPAA